MGLDMYLIKLTKVSDEEAAKKKAEDLECDYFTKDKRSEHLLKHVMPWLTESRISIPVWNMNKIKQSVGAPKGAHLTSERHRGDCIVEFGFSYDGKSYTAVINEDNAKDFKTRVYRQVYLVNMENVGYWRKHFPLGEAIHDAFLDTKKPEDRIVVENCGYYPLTGAVRRVIRKSGKPTFDPNDEFGGYGYGELKTDSPDSVICYHEWY